MIEALTDPFANGIGQRALVEVLLLGVVCGPLGVWLVLYRQAYAAESVAHGALPGLVVATLAGLPLFLGAAAGLFVAALAISLAARAPGVGSDAGVAVAVTALFGGGALLALAPEAPPRLEELLFGDPLGVSTAEIAASAGVAVVVLAGIARSHRRLALAAFDRLSAPSLGVEPGRVDSLLLLLLGLTALVAVQALGNLLVVALLIAPGAAALRLSGRLGPALALSAAIGVGSGVGGLYLSHHLAIATGAAMALVALGAAAASALIRSRFPVVT